MKKRTNQFRFTALSLAIMAALGSGNVFALDATFFPGNLTADSLNTSTPTPTMVGNPVGTTTINGSSISISGDTTVTGNLKAGDITGTSLDAGAGAIKTTGTLNAGASTLGDTNIDGTLDVTGQTTTAGIANTGLLANTGNITNSGNLSSNGNTTLGDTLGDTTIISGNTTVGGTLDLTGATTIGNELSVDTNGAAPGGNTLDVNHEFITALNPTGHGLTVTDTTTTLSGGGVGGINGEVVKASSTLLLEDNQATLSVGTGGVRQVDEVAALQVATPEIEVLKASNSGTATSIVLGGDSNDLNDILANVDNGVNNIIAHTNIISGESNSVGSNAGATNNIGTGANTVNNIGLASSTNTIIGSSTTITNGEGGNTLNVNAAGITALNPSQHGLTVTATQTTLSGGGVRGDGDGVVGDGVVDVNPVVSSSTLVLQESQATLSVGTAATPEIAVLTASNSGTATSITLGGESNELNNIQANVDNGVNNITAHTNTISGVTNSVGSDAGSANNIGTGANTVNNIGLASSTNTILGTTNVTGVTNINTGASTTATNIGGASSATNVGGTLAVTGQTTTNGIANTGLLANNGNLTNSGTLVQTGAATLNGATQINNTLGVTGQTTTAGIANTGLLANNGNMTNSGTLVQTGAATLNGATQINNTLGVTGQTTTAGIANTGNFTQTGVTNINTTGTAATTLGNNNAGTKVTARGGNATAALANDAASIAVTGVSTIGGMTVVNAGQTGAVVNANGQIGAGTTTETTAALTVTNSAGKTHGFVVNQSSATMSGGTQSTSMTLNDNGATFSNAATGNAVQLHGVAPGMAGTDAVNMNQLNSLSNTVGQNATRAYSGIAQIAAMSAIPTPVAGKNYSIGMGGGFYAGQQAIAFGGKAVIAENFTVGASFGTGFSSTDNMAASVGAGYSW